MKESIEDRIRLIMGNLATLRESIDPAKSYGPAVNIHIRERLEEQRLGLKSIADEIRFYGPVGILLGHGNLTPTIESGEK